MVSNDGGRNCLLGPGNIPKMIFGLEVENIKQNE
jgi:hypothetical protein